MSQKKIKVLICAVNWLGDSIMAMPALQEYRRGNPDVSLTVLAKSRVAAVWGMHPDVDDVIELGSGRGSLSAAVGEIRFRKFSRCFVFPNSFRSALIPFLAGISVRTGLRGHLRSWLLSDVIKLGEAAEKGHQSLEYYSILGLELPDEPAPPHIDIDSGHVERIREIASLDGTPVIGILPGAAYGPSKMWPADHFKELCRALVERNGYRLMLLGSSSESELCDSLIAGLEGSAVNLAGRTSLPELAAALSLCSGVVTNDSGGMHVAAAAGVPVAAVFGVTDFSKTGPLAKRQVLVYDEGVERSRDLDRNCPEAIKALKAIKADRVYDSLIKLMSDEDRSG